MTINSATIIYFSPTGTTKKIINSIIEGIGLVINNLIDLTSPKVRNEEAPSVEGDIVLIDVPVYATGVPNMVIPFLTSLKGNNMPVVIVAVYGNMSEGTALNELYSITKKSGFKVAAAGSFIGEHSFSTEETPIAKGRPNYEDLNKAKEFGENIMKKMQTIKASKDISLQIPQGKIPLIAKVLPKDSAKIFAKIPFADMSICNQCGICVNLCPMGAIDKDTLDIDKDKCIRCFCCVRRCPKKSRKVSYNMKLVVSQVFIIKDKIQKEPKVYL